MNFKKSVLILMLLSVIVSSCKTEEKIEAVEADEGSGFLVIETNPPNADIFFDNAYRDKSPVTLYNIKAGPHTIIIKKEDYEDSVNDVVIEAGKRSYLKVDLVQMIEEDKAEEKEEAVAEEEIGKGAVEEKPEALEEEIGTLKANGIVNIGNKFALYYDLSEGKFTENRQPDSDVFSKRFDKHIVFTRFEPAAIKAIEKGIDDVQKEDCIDARGQFEYLYSGKTLCAITKENEIAALGGIWEDTENAKLTWKLFS